MRCSYSTSLPNNKFLELANLFNNPVWAEYKQVWMWYNFYFFRRLKTGIKLAKAMNQITFMMCCFVLRNRNHPDKHNKKKSYVQPLPKICMTQECKCCTPWHNAQNLPKRSSHSKYQKASRYTRKRNFYVRQYKMRSPCANFHDKQKGSTALHAHAQETNLNQIGQ